MDEMNNISMGTENETAEPDAVQSQPTNADKWWTEPTCEQPNPQYTAPYVKAPPVYAPPVQPVCTPTAEIQQTQCNPTFINYATTARPPKKSNGLAIAALVLGIIGLLISFLPVFGYGLPTLAVIFGLIAVTDRRGTGIAVISVIFSVISVLICSLVTFAVIYDDVKNNGYDYNGDGYYEYFNYDDGYDSEYYI